MEIFLIPTIVVLIAVCMVTLAWIIDYHSGIQKAKERGEDLLSNGFRKSVKKATEYYKFISFGVMLDFFLILILYALDVPMKIYLPFFTMGFCVFIIRIEHKSVKEKASDKIRNKMPDINLVEIFKQPDAKARLLEAVKQLESIETNKENKDEENN